MEYFEEKFEIEINQNKAKIKFEDQKSTAKFMELF